MTGRAPSTPARLELTWPNKDKFLLVPKDENGRPVWVDWSHPSAREVRVLHHTGSHGAVHPESERAADNLIIQGDSLDALRALNNIPEYRGEYRGKVKLVYIDPPFNTGQTFKHYDDWMEHATWLSFMRDRLIEIRDLLAIDGTVWVHLDNYEIHRMRCLTDEVFGAENYINTVIWKRTTAKSAAKRGMGTMYDNILIYGKSSESSLSALLMPYSEDYLKTKYSNYDERGRYRLGDLSASGIRSGDSGLPWQGYDPASVGRHWAAPRVAEDFASLSGELSTRDRLDALLAAGFVRLPQNDGGAPQFKRYLDPDGGVAMGDVWTDLTVINSQAKERTGYDTQKPECLLERIIQMGSEPGDIVVDMFAGSGTTAAVAQKLNRRWVTAEILPATVEKYVEPRMAGLVDTQTLDSTNSGFRSLTVGPSMYEVLPGDLVVLADWATNGKFAEAVAAQLGFDFEPDAKPFSGRRGRMRLAVFDGAVGSEEVNDLLGYLGERENVTVVAKVVLAGAQEALKAASKGSRIRKAPRDLLTDGSRRSLRRTTGHEPGPAAAAAPEETL